MFQQRKDSLHIVESRYDSIKPGLGKDIAPALILDLAMVSALQSEPDASSEFGQRFGAIREKLEKEGHKHFKTIDSLLDEIKRAIHITEQKVQSSGIKASNASKVEIATNGIHNDVELLKVIKDVTKGQVRSLDNTTLCLLHPKPPHHLLDHCHQTKRFVSSRDYEGFRNKLLASWQSDPPASFNSVKGKGKRSHTDDVIRATKKAKAGAVFMKNRDGQIVQIDDSIVSEAREGAIPLSTLASHSEKSPETKRVVIKGNLSKLTKVGDTISDSEQSLTPSHTRRSESIQMLETLGTSVMEIAAKNVRVAGDRTNKILIDSGASFFMTPNVNSFVSESLKPSSGQVYLGDDSPIAIDGIGTVELTFGSLTKRIQDVLYVPRLAEALLSISHLIGTSEDSVIFNRDEVLLYDSNHHKLMHIGHKAGHLYYLDIMNTPPTAQRVTKRLDSNQNGEFKAKQNRLSYMEWHFRLGHASHDILTRTLRSHGISFNFSKDEITCPVCQLANFRKPNVSPAERTATRFLETLAEDTFPLEVETYYRAKYCIFIIDAFTRYAWALWAHSKDQIPQLFIQLCTQLETRYSLPIIEIRSDGGELACKEIQNFCETHKPNVIDFKPSPAHSQAVNGMVERSLGIYRARASSMLTTATLPARFFNFAMDYSIAIGRVLASTDRVTPYELVHHVKPNYQRFHAFGCLVAVYVPKKYRSAWIPHYHKAEPGIFLGYKGTRVILVYKFRTRRIHSDVYVRFCDTIFPGLSLQPHHLNPFLTGSYSYFTEYARGTENGLESADDDELEGMTHDDEDQSEDGNGDTPNNTIDPGSDEPAEVVQSPLQGEIGETEHMSSETEGELAIPRNSRRHTCVNLGLNQYSSSEHETMMDVDEAHEELQHDMGSKNDLDDSLLDSPNDHLSTDSDSNFEVLIGSPEPNDDSRITVDIDEMTQEEIGAVANLIFAHPNVEFSHVSSHDSTVDPHAILDRYENAPEDITMKLIDKQWQIGKKLFGLVAQASENRTPDTPITTQCFRAIKRELAKVDAKYEILYKDLEARRATLNETRRRNGQPLLDWADAADTNLPAETIHISEAPPPPKTLNEMLNGRFKEYFLRAMLIEMEALRTKGVFEVTKPPKGKRVIRSKWVFAYKTDPLGFINRFKARLVAVGCSQVKNHDYVETYSPVIKIKAVRFMLALSAMFGMHVEQLDIDTAYLYGNLKIANYMKLPHGFEEYDENGDELAAKLIKSLYGLHQSGREWYETIRDHLLHEMKFRQTVSDPCLFIKIDETTGQLVLVLIYVDDIMICSPSRDAIRAVRDKIRERFLTRDERDAEWVLKIQIERASRGIWIGQKLYATTVLKEFGKWDIPESQWQDTPMVCGWKHDFDSPLLPTQEKSRYSSLIMKLMYLAQQTRPDLLYAVNVLSQYQKEPRECDYAGALRVLEYLRGTHELGLFYQYGQGEMILFASTHEETSKSKFPLSIPPTGYCDASYGQEDDRKSRSGFVFYAFGCMISWYSKKQATTALSSTEAEIHALVEGIKESTWLRQLLDELNFDMSDPITLHEDNQSAIAIAIDPVHHSRVKHIEVKTYYIRENLGNQNVKLVYCPTDLMIADILTKALPAPQFKRLRDRMGLTSLSAVLNTQTTLYRLVVKDW